MKKTITAAAFALGALCVGLANDTRADEVSVKKILLAKYKSLPANTPVNKTEVKDIYEVNLQGKAAYTNEAVDFLLIGGSLINAATLEDVTAKRQAAFLKDFFATLPLESAFKRVYGKGERVMVSFEDPDCPFCHKQAQIFEANATKVNATVYTFLFPIPTLHPDGLRKAKYIACSANPAETLKLWMSSSKGIPLGLGPEGTMVVDPKAKTECAEAKKVTVGTDLARSLNYSSTPRFLFANGWGAKGYLDIEQIQEALRVVDVNMREPSKTGAAPLTAIKPSAPSASVGKTGVK